jgi:hypothetical protein
MKSNPTYRSLGNHSETVQIDYDPTVVTYHELLDIFWDSHRPVSRSASRQYGSVVFYHDDEQRQLAEASKEKRQSESGRHVPTEIVPYTEFWIAEDYHQKHSLRAVKDLMEEFEALYPDPGDFVDSTAVARANGYIGGHGALVQLEETIDTLGFSLKGQERLREIARRRLGQRADS